jgi:hypothetical protein
MKTARWLPGFVGIHLLIFLGLIFTENASATLVDKLPGSTCGGNSFKGTEAQGTVTDAAGNIFTLNCVDREYFEGAIFVKSTGKTTKFGRCIYDWGSNFINYEVDANNNSRRTGAYTSKAV